MHGVVFFVSASALLFQVAQTRLFSASLGYHLSYMVISVSLLGVGGGATLSALLDSGPRRPRTSSLAMAAGGACLMSLGIQTRIDPSGLGLGAAIGAAYVLGALPFVFASWIVVRSLREDPARSGSLYGADLAGAAVGSIVGYLALPLVGVPALYGVAGTLAAGGAILTRPVRRFAAVALFVGGSSILALAAAPEELAPAQPGPTKVAIAGPGITREATRWDPHARVDVLRYEDRPRGHSYSFLVGPLHTAERPDALTMVLDLQVVTPVLSGDEDLDVLRATVIAAPYAILERPSVLVLGAGAGIDIQTALVHGARQVDAVEVNRAVVGLMRDELAGYSGGLYESGEVHVYEDEARSFVRRSTDRYDLIALTVVDSYTALANGAYAVSESYLYTAEAFEDELAHLTDEGVLAVGRWYLDPPVEMIRIAQLAAGALQAHGIDDPERHLMVLRHQTFGLLMARVSPFGVGTTQAVREFAAEHGFAVAFDPLEPSAPFAGSLTAPAPATDDRPFFFATDLTYGQIPVAYAILFGALVPAVALSYLLLLAPLRKRWGAALGTRIAYASGVQALGLGAGFIAAEIVLLQRLTLFLGLPALALAVGLAGLLVGAAAGSTLSARLPIGISRAAFASGSLVIAGLALLAWISGHMLASPFPLKLMVAIALTASVGLPLGAVLPQVLRRAARHDDVLVPWVWAVNGAASVVGSIVAVAVAMTFGFTALGLAAAGCYLVVGLTEFSLRARATSPLLAKAGTLPT